MSGLQPDSLRGARTTNRKGYCNFLIADQAAFQVMKITKHPQCLHAIPADIPAAFLWPKGHDWDGAVRLVDAVLARDVVTLRRMVSEFPDRDLGLNAYLASLESIAAPAVVRSRVLTHRVGANGSVGTVELVLDARGRLGLRVVARLGERTIANGTLDLVTGKPIA